MNRSNEEFEMRRCIEVWGRKRWPDARLVHELVVAHSRRIDMAFIGFDYIVGIEIKSSMDTLDRLKDQVKCFHVHLPLLVLALAPKWAREPLCCPCHAIVIVEPKDINPVQDNWHRFEKNRACTVQMLDLLWAKELKNVAKRIGLNTFSRDTIRDTIGNIAQHATGETIVREVCRELRARDAFPKTKAHPPSDQPILEGAV